MATSARTFRHRSEAGVTDDPGPMSSKTPTPPLLARLVGWFEDEDEDCEHFAWVLRDSLDDVLDSHWTGRWCYQQLRKSEKKKVRTLVAVNITHEFDIPDGDELHWKIGGLEAEYVFSTDFGGWEIPMHTYLCDDHGELSGIADHFVLLVWMNDDDAQWAAGIVQVRDDLLGFRTDDSGRLRRQYVGNNRRRLNDDGMSSVHWLWGGVQVLPPNVLPPHRRALQQRLPL